MQGLLPDQGLVGLYGQPSGGKSFVALDWAMCISEGIPWLGVYLTKQAPVIYIAAEGGRGIQRRVRAWMQAHGVRSLSAIHWIVRPISIRHEGELDAFIETLQHYWDEDGEPGINPGLIVIDTLSRSFDGGDENSSVDMGEFVDGVTRLAAEKYTTVLVVHHSNAADSRERGHTILRCGADTMFRCKAEKNGDKKIVRCTVDNDKQKDDSEAETIYLQPKQGTWASLVFEKGEPPERAKRGEGPPQTMRKADMVTLLGSHADGLTWQEWRIASGIDKHKFNRRLKRLQDDGDVYKDDGRYYVMPANIDLAEIDEEDED
jgi:hypothetical protein